MRFSSTPCLAALMAATALLPACSKKEPVEYKLSAEQRAWQGYQAGEVLRFGHDKDSQVRTYRVTDVQDQLEEQYQGTNWVPAPSKSPAKYQRILVRVQRTDSTSLARPVLDLSRSYDVETGQVLLFAEAEWETFSYARLPLEAVNAGTPIDPRLYPDTQLLASARFGTITYTSVIHVRNPRQDALTNGSKLVRHLYYARGRGVVAFEEDGTGLWYRLP